MTRLRMFLWSLAERADWSGWPPRKLWRRMLRYCDRKAGLHKPVKPDPYVCSKD